MPLRRNPEEPTNIQTIPAPVVLVGDFVFVAAKPTPTPHILAAKEGKGLFGFFGGREERFELDLNDERSLERKGF